MKLTHTITIDGDTPAEYAEIKAHLEALHQHHPEWALIPEPLVNRMTATFSQDIEHLDTQ